jgi:hypothetical protein
MADDYPEIEAALRRFAFYRLEPDATLPARDTVSAEAAATGFALPDDYAWFCSVHGAGAFDEHAMLPLPPGRPLGPAFRLDILYAVGAREDWNPLALAEDTYLDRLPPGLLPVGTDPGGNLLLLGTKGRPGVYGWDHEHRELAEGELDSRTADLHDAGVDVQELDIDQLLLLWDEMFPDRVANPSGHGNLYLIADSFADACAALRGAAGEAT